MHVASGMFAGVLLIPAAPIPAAPLPAMAIEPAAVEPAIGAVLPAIGNAPVSSSSSPLLQPIEAIINTQAHAIVMRIIATHSPAITAIAAGPTNSERGDDRRIVVQVPAPWAANCATRHF